MKNTLKQQYMKERRRVQRFIKAAEKRGYIFDQGIVPAIPKRITDASIRRLKKLTPAYLYGKSQYVDKSTGEIISGKRGRERERSKAAKKGNILKRIKNRVKKLIEDIKAGKLTKKAVFKDEKPKDFTGGVEKPKTPPEWDPYSDNEPDFEPPPARPQNTNDIGVAQTIISNYRYHLRTFNELFATLMENWLNEVILKYGIIETAKTLEAAAEAGIIVTWKIAYKDSERLQYISSVMEFLPDLDEETRQAIWDAAQNDEDFWSE